MSLARQAITCWLPEAAVRLSHAGFDRYFEIRRFLGVDGTLVQSLLLQGLLEGGDQFFGAVLADRFQVAEPRIVGLAFGLIGAGLRVEELRVVAVVRQRFRRRGERQIGLADTSAKLPGAIASWIFKLWPGKE